jgi:hypothetical protein
VGVLSILFGLYNTSDRGGHATRKGTVKEAVRLPRVEVGVICGKSPEIIKNGYRYTKKIFKNQTNKCLAYQKV